MFRIYHRYKRCEGLLKFLFRNSVNLYRTFLQFIALELKIFNYDHLKIINALQWLTVKMIRNDHCKEILLIES